MKLPLIPETRIHTKKDNMTESEEEDMAADHVFMNILLTWQHGMVLLVFDFQ